MNNKSKLITVFMFLIIFCFLLSGCSKAVFYEDMQEMDHSRFERIGVYNGGLLGSLEYILYDTETGVMYVQYYNGNVGIGMTVLLDTDGKPLIYDGYDKGN